jgi:hypothetical protein
LKALLLQQIKLKMTYCVSYYFNNKYVESLFIDEKDFVKSLIRVESLIIKNLKEGKNLQDQKEYWTGMIEDINEDWDTIEVNSNGMKNFVVAIIILKKLKVEFDCPYGFMDKETFQRILLKQIMLSLV